MLSLVANIGLPLWRGRGVNSCLDINLVAKKLRPLFNTLFPAVPSEAVGYRAG